MIIDLNRSLDTFDRENVEEFNFLFVAIDYRYGNYEGSGHAIGCFDKDDWHHHDCGHCSCYGFVEHWRPRRGKGKTLDELIETMSDDLKKECKNVIKAARKFEGGKNE